MFDPLVIEPGKLRHNIVIQSPSTTRDASGQPGATWSVLLTTCASIESTSSLTFKFSFQNNTLASESTDCITMRFNPSAVIAPGMRVVFGDLTYLINAVNNVQERNRVLILACTGIDIASS